MVIGTKAMAMSGVNHELILLGQSGRQLVEVTFQLQLEQVLDE